MIFKICHSPNVKNIKYLSILYTMNCETNISMHSSKGNLKTKNKQTKQIKTTINHRFKPFFFVSKHFSIFTRFTIWQVKKIFLTRQCFGYVAVWPVSIIFSFKKTNLVTMMTYSMGYSEGHWWATFSRNKNKVSRSFGFIWHFVKILVD